MKSGIHPEALLEQLYRQTPLEEQFNVNAVALVGGKPVTLGLIEMLRVFLDHRLEVVRRRSDFRRGRPATDCIWSRVCSSRSWTSTKSSRSSGAATMRRQPRCA